MFGHLDHAVLHSTNATCRRQKEMTKQAYEMYKHSVLHMVGIHYTCHNKSAHTTLPTLMTDYAASTSINGHNAVLSMCSGSDE
jgi:phosphoribosylcarboxyaminoimidazole (NCAIR) mutase